MNGVVSGTDQTDTDQMRLALALIAVVCLASPARTEVAHSADNDFDAALADWLSGNEAGALPALAELAANGHASARLLLGQIDRFPALQGTWLAGLSRADRIAVLRQPGGVSGHNWTKELALLAEPSSAAWDRLWDAAATTQVILEFARLGEQRAARFAALTLSRRQQHGFAAIADHPDYAPSLWAFAMREGWQPPGDGPHPADPQRVVLGQEPDLTGFSEWAATAPEADAVVALCEVLCPSEDPSICRPPALTGLGGYWGLMQLGSPVESIVPSDVFNRSPKGIDTTLRHMRGPVESACLTDALN